MDSDLSLCRRLLCQNTQIDDPETIDQWELSQSGEEFDCVQKVDKEIEGLKNCLLQKDPGPRTLNEDLLKKTVKKHKLKEKILKGVVFKTITKSETLRKKGTTLKLIAEQKNEEIAALQREAEVRGKQLAEMATVIAKLETTCSSLTERLKDKENETVALLKKASFHAEQEVLTSKAFEVLSITVGNLTQRLTEAEDDRAKKLAQKDSKINHILAEKDRLIGAHGIECNALRSKTERNEAKFEEFMISLRIFGGHCGTFRTAMEDMDSDHSQIEKDISITCLKSGNQETGWQEGKRKRAVNEESTPGPSKRQLFTSEI